MSSRRACSLGLMLPIVAGASCSRQEPAGAAPPRNGAVMALPESTLLAREVGAALAEESRFDDAERAWKEIVRRPDSTPQDMVSLARIYFGRYVVRQDNVPTGVMNGWTAEARRLCEQALAQDDALAAGHYVLGVLARDYAFDVAPSYAVDHLRRAVALAPEDVGARFNLASALENAEEREAALPIYEEIVAQGKEFTGVYWLPAFYRRAQLLNRRNRGDDRERARVLSNEYATFPKPASNTQAERDQKFGILGRVRASAITPAAESKPAAPARVAWEPARLLLEEAGAVRGFDVADLDGDHRDDFVAAGEQGAWVAFTRGTGGAAASFEEVRVAEGRLDGVVAAELENAVATSDAASLVLWGADGVRLLTPDGKGGFTDDSAHLPRLEQVTGFVPVDFDHDGNLDLLALAGGRFRLLRSRGVPRTDDEQQQKTGPIEFDDVTEESGLAAASGSWARIEDFDGDHDVDLIVGGAGAPTILFSNLRRGKFEALGGARTGLPDALTAAPLLCDLDHDSLVDVLVAGAASRMFKGRGDLTFAAAESLPARLVRTDPSGATFLDVDLDGEPEWIDAPVVTDVDLDGALDRVAPGANGLAWGRGRLDGAPRRELLLLRGRKDNRFAVGAVVEVRCGGRYERRFVLRPTQLFGFAAHDPPVLRITWPDGVVQYPLQSGTNEDVEFVGGEPAPAGGVVEPEPDPRPDWSDHPRLPLDLSKELRFLIRQKKGPPGSCPFLYSWNGSRYVFVTDVLGATPLGLPIDEQRYVEPDHDELVRMTSDQIAPTDGEYRVQLTEELRETTYLDRAQLWVVDHEAGVEVHPEERFCFPPFPQQHLHAVRDVRPLVRAVDGAGRDWTAELAGKDDVPAVPFTPLAETYRGLATTHTLELTLPDAARTAARIRLLMTGWLMWGDASVNLAIAHRGTLQFLPPVVSAPDGDGSGTGGWHDCGPPVGFPAGKTKTMVLDVTAMLNRADPRLRFTSTLELYWDQIQVALDEGDAPVAVTKLEPKKGELWFRGFSQPQPGRRPEQPLRFEWDRLEERARFDQHVGMLTRYGDVIPLLDGVDDRFVILSAGDAIDLRFDAAAIPSVLPGMARTYLLYLDGWAKDADPNTTFSQTVDPLPFHGMSGYPYGEGERYPDDEEHARYRADWNTRPGRRLIESLVPPRPAASSSGS